ncbi:MAG: hypothetical protein Q8M98_08845 [Candidatus Cloacimonadaceae bacterium]|nr:hypothetical protein [Candidatus Cloacimonadaceae bacterium]MDP3114871.1 hypothetical protein [Candidatus Cloacimonadaceae bacterium]
MKQIYALLAFLLLIGILGAAQMDYPDLIGKTIRYLNVYPADASERINLAYYYMMDSKPDMALAQYQWVERENPNSGTAGEGILWALNSLKMYRHALAKADSLIAHHPHISMYRVYKGQAELQSGKPLRARLSYQKVLSSDQSDSLSQALARDGLGWAYLAVNDYGGAITVSGDIETPSSPLREATRWHTFLTTGFSYKETGNYGFSASLGLQKRTWAMLASYHDQYVKDAHYRYMGSFKLGKQTKYADFGFRAATLIGEYEPVYPGKSFFAAATGKLYLSDALIKPIVAIHLSSYSRMNAYQGDLGFNARYGRMSVSYGFSGVYHDLEALDSDLREYVHTLGAAYQIFPALKMALHWIKGETSWWIDASGIIYDDFYGANEIYGLSAYLSLSRSLSLGLYYHLGIENDEYSDLIHTNISLRY